VRSKQQTYRPDCLGSGWMRVGGDVLVWEEEENRKGKQNVERRNSK
jgi:hypothetical protein